MKRYGNLYERICSYDNLLEAFHNACHGKGRRFDIVEFESNLESNLKQIQKELLNHTYKTSEYTLFYLYEPKERLIYRLPFRDRIVQWAIMLVIEPIWTKNLTRDTYACVRGRGIHSLLKKLHFDLKNNPGGTAYCLKIDVRKFYPTIDHEIMKKVIRKKIKDPDLLFLLDGIIDSVDSGKGVPIGNYLSQFFANLYLSELDHLIKEVYKVSYYYRYADDIVILASTKPELHGLLVVINDYLNTERNLSLKGNFQIFPVESRGIDFVGYISYHTHILARKKNKKALCRAVFYLRKKGFSDEEIRLKVSSRLGFMVHCDSINLLNKIGMKKFSDVKKDSGNLTGTKYHIDTILNREIHLKGFEITESKYKGKCLTIQYDIYEELKDSAGNILLNEDNTPQMGWVEHISFTGSEALMKQLDGVELDEPCAAQIIKQPTEKGKCFYKMTDPSPE
jgi:retron-type reverse transcriptase